MMRKLTIVASLTLALAVIPVTAGADRNGGGADRARPTYTPGSAGIGDEYFPLDGNGGYDVDHYDLEIRYDPATGVLQGTATIRARATQDLSRFNLDLQGLTVRSVEVDRHHASYVRADTELTVTPAKGLRRGSRFTTMVRYDGVPEPVLDPFGGQSGFLATDDGALIVGQPDVAATWFPVNDHPSDAATYSFTVTVPAGTEVVANGRLTGTRTRGGWTTWTWEAREPMASYLATASMGEFLIHAYRADGIRFWDAIDPGLFEPVAPHSGAQAAVSQTADLSYKRLARTISVPAGGATMTFWVSRSTETTWDFFFVEAHHVGGDDWTTLPEASGLTDESTGNSCPLWLDIHPFLARYQTASAGGGCDSVGTPPTGEWHAVTGFAPAWQQWTIDLGAYAGSDVEISLAYASDDIVQAAGVAIDDIVVSTGEGSTSFEDDGDTFDGWTVMGPPPGSPGNDNDWIAAGQDLLPTSVGEVADASLARQPEILRFLSGYFGRYPFDEAGGIVDDVPGLGFALENQTRPIYSPVFFTDSVSGDSVVVHELTHQWFGDDLRLARWKDIWLNEGFATYAEWMWSEHEGLGSPQQQFDDLMAFIPADDPFWTVPIGDPGPDLLFDGTVYFRGALTLHALRLTVGDDVFFDILRTWARRESGEAVSTAAFIDLAESISHQQLDDLFNAWLYTPTKPAAPPAVGARAAATAPSVASLSAVLRAELARWPIEAR